MNGSISNLKSAFIVASLLAGATLGVAQQQHDQSFMHVYQGRRVAQQEHRHDQSFMHVNQGLETKQWPAPGHLTGLHTISRHQPPQKKKDTSVHHAAMHAEHWLDHHSSAPHGKAYQHRAAVRKHNFNHAVKHTEHWVNHHASAPHKGVGSGGGK